MTFSLPKPNYIYNFNCDVHHVDLCKMETRQIFKAEATDNLLFSEIEVDPSISTFIKNRFEIILSSDNYPNLLVNIQKENIEVDGFKAEYHILDNDATEYTDRLQKMKDIGYSIEGEPDYINPSIIYSVCIYKGIWYFGILTKTNADWQKHKQKPFSFSNSISMKIAKTLISIASKGDKSKHLIDACCGVGTIVLEACYAGFDIEGCDINWKACQHTRNNLEHYKYIATIYRSDIKDIDKKYDAAIIDLPYNLYAYSDDAISLNIIQSTAKLSKRIVIVSISDIEPIIKESGLKIVDFCTVVKRGTSNFTRSIWVCEKEMSI